MRLTVSQHLMSYDKKISELFLVILGLKLSQIQGTGRRVGDGMQVQITEGPQTDSLSDSQGQWIISHDRSATGIVQAVSDVISFPEYLAAEQV